MAESILVTGKKISSMELVTNVTGSEKIPTGQPDDLAITPDQIADHTILRGDLASQEDLSQVEVNLTSQIGAVELEVANQSNSIRGLLDAETQARISGDDALEGIYQVLRTDLDAETQARIAADDLKVDKAGSVKSVAGRTGDVVLEPSDIGYPELLAMDNRLKEARFIQDANGKNQQEINDNQEEVNLYGAKTYDMPTGGYPVGGLVRLSNGDIVKSTIPNNTNDPNIDMTGWFLLDLSGKNSNFVEKWGAKGDGVTNDSAAIQSAINDLSAKFLSTGQEQTLLFSGNKTYVCRQVALKAGVHYQGVNGRSRIKKTPAGAITDETVLKWWRIFSVSQNEPSFNTDAARKVRHRLANLVFDGNRDNMNWSGGYAQEQAASLFLTGNVSSMLTSVDQRSKFQVDNCLFVNSVADGLAIWYNADVIVNNEEAINCFRGGLVASGGNTKVLVNGYVGTNARIDFEIDASGFAGTHKFDWTVNNVEIDRNNPSPAAFAGSDLCVSDGGAGVGNNVRIYSTPVNFNGRGLVSSKDNTSLEFNNSLFHMRTETSRNYIYPCNTKFNFCEFVATGTTGLSVSWGVNGGEAIKNKLIDFYRCTFSHAAGVDINTLASAVVSNRVLGGVTGNVMRFRECNIPSKFAVGVNNDGEVTTDWSGGAINAVTAFRSVYAYNAAPIRLRLGTYQPLSDNVNMLTTNSVNVVVGVQNAIEFNDLTLPLSKSSVVVDGGSDGRFHAKVGGRLILSDTAPAAVMSAYNGDVLRLNTVPAVGPYEWVCTTVNFANTANTWKPTKWNMGSFTTANLPALTAFDVGVQNIDATLNKLVTWNGTAWV